VPITFPTSPTDNQEFTHLGRTYTYNYSRGVWLGSRGGSLGGGGGSGGSSVTVSDTAPVSPSEGDLWFHSTLLETYVYYNSQWVLSNPTSGGGGGGSGGGTTAYANLVDLPQTATTGDMALVEATDKLYIWNDTAWYNIAIINTAPTITQGGAGTYSLADDGTPTVITLTATDPEGLPVTWSYAVTSGSLTNGGGATATISQADNVFTITPTTTEAYAGTFELTFSVTDGANTETDVNTFSLTFASANYANGAANDVVVADSNVTRGTLGTPTTSTETELTYDAMVIDADGEGVYYQDLPTFDFNTSGSANNRLVFAVKIVSVGSSQIGVSATDNTGNYFCIHTYNNSLVYVPHEPNGAGSQSYTFDNYNTWFDTSKYIIYTINAWDSTTGLSMTVKQAGVAGTHTVTATSTNVGYLGAYNTNHNSVSFFGGNPGSPIGGYTARSTLTQKVVGVMTMPASISSADAIDEFEAAFFT